MWGGVSHSHTLTHTSTCLLQVRAEITSKEKEEEDLMEKVQKETK